MTTNKAKLQLNKSVYTFAYDPQTFKIEVSTELAANQVLDATNPDLRGKSSAVSYTLDRCLLLSAGLKQSQKDRMAALTSLAVARQPLLFSYGIVRAGSVYITKLDFDVKNWRDGNPTHVEANISLRVARDAVSKTKPTAAKGRRTTENMQAEYTRKIQLALKSPVKLKQLGLSQPITVVIADDGVVTVSDRTNKSVGTLADYGLK